MSEQHTKAPTAKLATFLAEVETKSITTSSGETLSKPRETYDGLAKTKHPIYQLWRKMLSSHLIPSRDVDNVSGEFKDFKTFWTWYKSQVTHIQKPLDQEFNLVRLDKKQIFSQHNCQLVLASISSHPLDISNHLTMTQIREFQHLVESQKPIRIFASYFKWSLSKAAKIVKHYKSKQLNTDLEAQLVRAKPQNLSSMMVADSKKRKFNI